MGRSRCSSVRKSVDAPPGSRPRKRTPSRIPPACSSRISRIGVPIGSSHRPGCFTLPLAPYSFVPPSLVRLRFLNQLAPWLMMCGTLQSVSTLFTVVGLPQRPATGGKGGFERGFARLPSSAFNIPVSSPHMYRPALMCKYIFRLYEEPRIFLPRYPISYASAIALETRWPARLYSPRRNTYATSVPVA